MGRPRSFDLDKALDQALEVFHRNGYEGASVAELTEAMGINPPSLYAAFGNKEALFRRALDRYASRLTCFWTDALNAPTARGMVAILLRETANFLTKDCTPPGCLFVRSAVSCSEATDAIRRELNARRTAGEVAIRERLERAVAEGELPADIDPEDVARYIATVLEGMSVQAAGGATREDLLRVAEFALRTLPSTATDQDAAAGRLAAPAHA